LTGNENTVTAGAGNLTIGVSGTGFAFNDTSTDIYSDTITGFGQSGDSINLAGGDTVATSSVSGGNTQIVLSDGSQILLIGVTNITGFIH